MDRRKSLVYCGAEADDITALRSQDESFYGFVSESGSTSSDSDSTATDEEASYGAAKRSRYNSSSDDTSADEYYGHVDLAATGGGGGLRGQSADDTLRGSIAASIRDNKDMGCQCRTNNHWQCLPSQDLEDLMVNISAMDKHRRKQYALGELAASAAPTHSVASARNLSVRYKLLGHEVCRGVFLEVHGISRSLLKILLNCVEKNESQPPEHARLGMSANNKLPDEDVQNVITFLQHYASCHGIPQPAAPRGRGKPAPVYLPASCTKEKIYKIYEGAEGAAKLSLTSFKAIWRKFAGDIMIMKRRSDVCARCDKLREKVRLAKTEEGTRQALADLTKHMDEADREREFYKRTIADAKEMLSAQDNNGIAPAATHITFDYAQQLELPHHTRQVGPLYFKSRFKVQLFGICNEPRNVQCNYIFHEGESIGPDGAKAHGPNAVVSMLHHHLQGNVEERSVCMHANNCVGQNKNRTVMAYLCWRVIHGLSDEMSLAFMRVGHTRCSVDAKFGRLKQSYCDVVQAINSSCAANVPVRYCWTWSAWDSFLDTFFKPIKGIRSYQHFRATKEKPGVLFIKSACNDKEFEFPLLRPCKSVESVVAAGQPQVLLPGGISEKRLGYLQSNIAEFLSEGSLPPWCNDASGT